MTGGSQRKWVRGFNYKKWWWWWQGRGSVSLTLLLSFHRPIHTHTRAHTSWKKHATKDSKTQRANEQTNNILFWKFLTANSCQDQWPRYQQVHSSPASGYRPHTKHALSDDHSSKLHRDERRCSRHVEGNRSLLSLLRTKTVSSHRQRKTVEVSLSNTVTDRAPWMAATATGVNVTNSVERSGTSSSGGQDSYKWKIHPKHVDKVKEMIYIFNIFNQNGVLFNKHTMCSYLLFMCYKRRPAQLAATHFTLNFRINLHLRLIKMSEGNKNEHHITVLQLCEFPQACKCKTNLL